jgi:DNA-binding LytR/AlgR family response regulator
VKHGIAPSQLDGQVTVRACLDGVDARRGRSSSHSFRHREEVILTYRLKDLEKRLDPERFVRLGRGTLANVDSIARVNVMPGGTHLVILGNGQRLPLSRLQSRALRDRFLKL